MADRVNLAQIKTQLKSIFDAANTTTASPIDLSSNLTTRVQRVFKVHPAMIQPQASLFPYVTCYISDKEILRDDISKDQLSAKRRAKIKIDVVGAVWNQNYISDESDPADEDINYLMENIELVLRTSPTINSYVQWQFPNSIEYYVANIDEQTHLRAGILKIEATVFY